MASASSIDSSHDIMDHTESPPSSMDESTDEPVTKGCGVGVFGYEGSPAVNSTILPVDPKVC